MTRPDPTPKRSANPVLAEVRDWLRRARPEQIKRLLSDIQRSTPERASQSEAK
ncbi:hypothetical protein ACN2XU_09700 [Primorskyibacter sp. 2E107]|uniref:hypothetical protein n=1 Tax=Primorskyibacter sp. 2E107 TaxID=3403458 RepID=UPI003AF9DDB6